MTAQDREPRRGATAFRYEADLVERATALLPEFLAERSPYWSMASELTVGAAIADIVVALLRRPLGTAVRALSVRDSVVLAALRDGGATRIDLLESRCGLERGGLRAGDLDRLVSAGLVERCSGGRVAASAEWGSGVELIAIEAKLTRWRQAVRQAAAYARYADAVYVLLPASETKQARWAEACAAQGVGLLLLDHDALSEHVPAARRSGHDWRREYALSRVLAQA